MTMLCDGCGTDKNVKQSLHFDLCPKCEHDLREAYIRRAAMPMSRDNQCPVPEIAHK
jgi:hypothetical protein